jgi:hypothetical protein
VANAIVVMISNRNQANKTKQKRECQDRHRSIVTQLEGRSQKGEEASKAALAKQ